MKNILFVLIGLLIFTFLLNTYDHSKFQKTEYSNICHSIYSEKVWIDTCNFPMIQNNNTYELAMKIEILAIVIIGVKLLYFKKLNIKN